MTGFLRLMLVFFGAMLLQWWWSTHGLIAGLAPQVLLVMTVTVAARYGALRGMLVGFCWGLFLDVTAARLVGANALALTLAAYGTGSMRKQVDLFGIGPQSVMVFGATIAYFALIGVLGALFQRTFLWPGWDVFLVSPFYNVLVALLVFGFWEAWLEPRR